MSTLSVPVQELGHHSIHGSVYPRLLQSLYFGCSQGLYKLSIVYELICRLGILCDRIIERLLDGKNILFTKFLNGRWRDNGDRLINDFICQTVRLVYKRIRKKRAKFSQIYHPAQGQIMQ